MAAPALAFRRLDQGVDLQGAPGQQLSLRVPTRVLGVVTDTSPGGGFGRYVVVQPRIGPPVYFGHALPLVQQGDQLAAGAPIVQLLEQPGGNATQPGWVEIGQASGLSPAGRSTAARAWAWLQGNLMASTASAGGNAASPTISSPDEYWYAVESALGIPHNHASKAFLTSWANAEGTSAQNNPLATTLKLPGSKALGGNPDGVQQYATPEQGVQATAATIRKYPAVLAVLQGHAAPFNNPALNRELNIWSGQRSAGTKMTDYVKNIILGFQGNPSGSSAADWFSNVGGSVIPAIEKGIKAPIAWAQGFANLLGKLVDAHFWWRVGLMLAGGVLMLAGLVFLAKSSGVAVPLPVP